MPGTSNVSINFSISYLNTQPSTNNVAPYIWVLCDLCFCLTLVLSKANSKVLPLVRNISTALSLSCHQRLCTSLISSYVQEKEGASVSPWRLCPNTKTHLVLSCQADSHSAVPPLWQTINLDSKVGLYLVVMSISSVVLHKVHPRLSCETAQNEADMVYRETNKSLSPLNN